MEVTKHKNREEIAVKNRVVVVGHGYFGSIVRERVAQSKNFALVGVVDPDYQRLNSVDGMTVAESYDKFAANVDHDAVIICAPPKLHAGLAVDALDRDKNVLCQKPGALEMREVNMIRNAIERSAGIYCVDYTPEHAPEWEFTRGVAGQFGDVRIAEFTRMTPFPARDIGEVFDLMPHDVALMLGLMRHDLPMPLMIGAGISDNGIDARIYAGDDSLIATISAGYNVSRPQKKVRITLDTESDITNPAVSMTWDQTQRCVSIGSQGSEMKTYFSHDIDPISRSLGRFAWRCDYGISDINSLEEVTKILLAINSSVVFSETVEVEL